MDAAGPDRSATSWLAQTDVAQVSANLLKHHDPRCFQHPGQPDQRQANQASWVIPFQPIEQRDPQPFGFETARALIRLLPTQIALDHGRRQHPEYDTKLLDCDLPPSAGAVQQAQSGMKNDGAP